MPTTCARFTPNQLNFSAGPGALPDSVLRSAQEAVLALPETGISVLGMSHRSSWFEAILAEAENNLRILLDIPESYAVCFLQGGSSLQFSMIPLNFGSPTRPGAYLRSGYWSAKAIEEARCVAPLDVIWDGAPLQYRVLPDPDSLAIPFAAPYVHYVSNETIEGLQFGRAPSAARTPWVVDMSSDFLSKPIRVQNHAMIYAHAQKNVGPAGVTICIIDRRLLESIPAGLPPMLDYRTHVQHRSNYNTPPVFGIYVLTLVTRWLRESIGGLGAMAAINRSKAATLYGSLERTHDVLETHAMLGFRSTMNAAFRFRDARLDALFLAAANDAGFAGLEGHRSLGGMRASMYNAVSLPAVAALSEFLEDFCAAHA